MIKNTFLATILFCAVAWMFFSESAWARVQAIASWKIAGNSQQYTGIGGSNEQALEAARMNCKAAQAIADWRNFCLNAPERLEYSTIPGGTYTKSCGVCGVRKEGGAEILGCSFCKPVMERRELNLSQCPADARDKIENCHGELICGVCP